MKQLIQNAWRDESGQGLVEYVLIIALVSIGLIAIMVLFRDSIGTVFNTVKGQLDAAPDGGYTP